MKKKGIDRNEPPAAERVKIQARIAEFRKVKRQLAVAHGRRIPRSLLGRESGLELAKIILAESDGKRESEDAGRQSICANGYAYVRTLNWHEIMEQAHKQIDADLAPYVARLKRLTKKRIKDMQHAMGA